ncbi:MAG TPA: PIN domain-containing protein [Solirubrobacteraceae bacterium]
MTAVYVDTSALGRVLLGEPQARSILRALGRFDQHVASRLASVELRRLALRHDCLTQAVALLKGVALLPLDEELLDAAATLAPLVVGTLDAIHLATALTLSREGLLDSLMTYDAHLAKAAAKHGLAVAAPR